MGFCLCNDHYWMQQWIGSKEWMFNLNANLKWNPKRLITQCQCTFIVRDNLDECFFLKALSVDYLSFSIRKSFNCICNSLDLEESERKMKFKNLFLSLARHQRFLLDLTCFLMPVENSISNCCVFVVFSLHHSMCLWFHV